MSRDALPTGLFGELNPQRPGTNMYLDADAIFSNSLKRIMVETPKLKCESSVKFE